MLQGQWGLNVGDRVRCVRFNKGKLETISGTAIQVEPPHLLHICVQKEPAEDAEEPVECHVNEHWQIEVLVKAEEQDEFAKSLKEGEVRHRRWGLVLGDRVRCVRQDDLVSINIEGVVTETPLTLFSKLRILEDEPRMYWKCNKEIDIRSGEGWSVEKL